jgi:hemoglobin
VQIDVFRAVGGAPYFERLVARFYAAVAVDPVLRPVYPPDRLEEAEHWLGLFLIQYWGGPTSYSEERGHPRLRMRHAPFAIGEAERDAWLRHMTDAVRAERVDPAIEARLLEYFDAAAAHMVNT